MKINQILEVSQNIVQQFNSFFDEVTKKKEIMKYGDLRIREIYKNKDGYVMQFQLKPQYSKLKNSDKTIRYIMRLLKDIGMKYNKTVKIKRDDIINNQAVIKIIFKEEVI